MATRHLHTVFFALENSSPEMIQSFVDDCRTYLKPHDGVEFFATGPRVTDCVRDVNDQDFHVGLTLLFRDREAHDSYQVSPKHREFIERNKGNFARVRVFDSNAQAG
jgi:hypothetical protein